MVILMSSMKTSADRRGLQTQFSLISIELVVSMLLS